MTITENDIFETYYRVPASQRRTAHWEMSQETLDQIKQLPSAERTGPIFDNPAALLGRPIRIRSEAVGITLLPECTCDLVDVTTVAGPAFVRGFSRGCQLHPETEYERKIREAEEAWEAKVEAAKRAAREAP